MKLEILLSVMNYKLKDLDKHNITSDCTVINQCDKEEYKEYKNFKIYNNKEKGISKSRNEALRKSSGDILLFCDDDVVYNDDYENIVINEFNKNKKADVIIFNFNNLNRKKRINKRTKRLHLFNSLNYATYNIAIRKDSLKGLRFDETIGPGTKYANGSDSVFIKSLFDRGLKVYTSSKYLGTVSNEKSTWFNGYNEKFFYNKGALFTAINRRFRKLLFIQFLIRHKEVLVNLSFKEAYKNMIKGSNDYLKDLNNYYKNRVLQVSVCNTFRGIEKLELDEAEFIKDYIFDFLTPTYDTFKNYEDRIVNSKGVYYNFDIERNNLFNKIKYSNKLHKFLKDHKYNIVHINSTAFFFVLNVAIIAKLCGIKKIIIHSHSVRKLSFIKTTIIKILNPLLYHISDEHLACSNNAAKHFYNKKYLNNIDIIKNGLDIDLFKYNESIRKKYRKELKIDNKIVYGNVAALDKRKNHIYLINLFNEIQKKQPNSVLLIIGKGQEENNIKKLIKQLHLEDKVMMLGFRDDISNLLNAMDVFIFPCTMEAFGIAPLEAYTNGLKVYCLSNVADTLKGLSLLNIFDLEDKLSTIADRIIKEDLDYDRNKGYIEVKKNGYDIKATTKKLRSIYMR